MSERLSLEEFAEKRFRLAGKSLVDQNNLCFCPTDRLRSEIEARGKSLINFAHYDYLGLSGHEAIRLATLAALDQFGTGALGSRLVGGERSIHADFENAIARFVGTEASLALVSGYLTNVSIISHLLGANDLLIIDEFCHNSIVSGAKATKATLLKFRHNDFDNLQYLLGRSRDSFRNCLIVIEGLYSMDGDLPDLPDLLTIKEQEKCWLLVDEAHSIGTLGDHGRGISEYFGEDPQRIDLIVGTLSKSLVSCGGFLCGRKAIIDWLRYTLGGFVYSVGLSPVITAAAHAALNIIVKEPQRVARLRANSERFRRQARASGLNTGGAIGVAVVPVLFGDFRSTFLASEALLKANILAPPIAHVGVPKDAPRIRFFLSAKHEPDEIDQAIAVLSLLSSSQSLSPLTVGV
jgi:8-amino-7-oxononanoate synthase